MVDSGPSLSELGLTKTESHQFKRRSVRPDDELAQINYFRSHPKQREIIVTNPFAVDTEEQIKNLFEHESKWSVLQAAILAEPDGSYELTFSKLSRSDQQQKLYDQIDSSAEMTIRIQKYIVDNLSVLDQVSDEELYNILCRTAFGSEVESEIQTKYALSQRRGFRMSIVNFLEERSKLSVYRLESTANPKAFAEKYLKNQFTGNISIEQLPIGFIIYLDEQDYALIESDDKNPKSIPSRGVTFSSSWLPQELQGKIILINRGGKETGTKTAEELASTRGHEIRHILFGEFHALKGWISLSKASEILKTCKTKHDYRMVSGELYGIFAEVAKNEVIAYFSEGKFNESYEALVFHKYRLILSEAVKVLKQRTDLSEKTKIAIMVKFQNDQRKCFEAIKRIRLVAEKLYKQDDSAQNDFREALLRNTPGTKIHRLVRYTGLTVDELRDGRIIKENDQQAIEKLSNVLNIPKQYDELGQMALQALQKNTTQSADKYLPAFLKEISEELSKDDWGEKASQAMQQMTKQLPVESLPVLLDAATKWSDRSWTFPWVEPVLVIIKDFIEVYGLTAPEKLKIIQAMNKVLEKKADKNFEEAVKLAQQVVDQITPSTETNGKNPFEGITFFDEIDSEIVHAIESGTQGQNNWFRAEYYPRAGFFRFLKKENGGLEQLEHNGRLNESKMQGFYYGSGKSWDEEEKSFIAQGMELLDAHQISHDVPQGYVEVQKAIETAMEAAPIEWQNMEKGKLYCVAEQDIMDTSELRKLEAGTNIASDQKRINRFHIFRFDHNVEKNEGQTRIHVAVYGQSETLLGPFGQVTVDPKTFEPSYDTIDDINPSFVAGNYIQKATQKADPPYRDWFIYEINEESARIIGSLRPPIMDKLIGTDTTRESLCLQVAFDALQYARWSLDEPSPRSEELSRSMPPEKYHAALAIMIDRFGSKLFSQNVKELMESQFRSLHTKIHDPDIPRNPHSDIATIESKYMNLAKQVISNAHPLPDSMSRGFVGNIRPLFGDPDFWSFLREQQPKLFEEFIEFLGTHPPITQNASYNHATVHPAALIRQYFPVAFQEIQKGRPEFATSAIQNAIEIPEQYQQKQIKERKRPNYFPTPDSDF